jgi:hypothetical protein
MFVHFGRWGRQPSFDNSESQALDFARNVHSDMLGTNRDLYTRAQWILTLDGVFTSLVAGRFLTAPKDLRPAITEFTPLTWALLTLVCMALMPSRPCGRWNGSPGGRTWVVCGPSGTGKRSRSKLSASRPSKPGCAAWFRLEDLGVLIRAHRTDDSATWAVAQIPYAELVVIDDLGLLAVPTDAAEGLDRVVYAAYENGPWRSGLPRLLLTRGLRPL